MAFRPSTALAQRVTPLMRLESIVLTDVTLFVANPEVAVKFYSMLGGSLDNDGSNTVWFGDSAIQVWPGDRPSQVHLSINVQNSAAIAAQLSAQGVAVEWTDEQRRAFTVSDPDGNTVMVRHSDCWHR